MLLCAKQVRVASRPALAWCASLPVVAYGVAITVYRSSDTPQRPGESSESRPSPWPGRAQIRALQRHRVA